MFCSILKFEIIKEKKKLNYFTMKNMAWVGSWFHFRWQWMANSRKLLPSSASLPEWHARLWLRPAVNVWQWLSVFALWLGAFSFWHLGAARTGRDASCAIWQSVGCYVPFQTSPCGMRKERDRDRERHTYTEERKEGERKGLGTMATTPLPYN